MANSFCFRGVACRKSAQNAGSRDIPATVSNLRRQISPSCRVFFATPNNALDVGSVAVWSVGKRMSRYDAALILPRHPFGLLLHSTSGETPRWPHWVPAMIPAGADAHRHAACERKALRNTPAVPGRRADTGSAKAPGHIRAIRSNTEEQKNAADICGASGDPAMRDPRSWSARALSSGRRSRHAGSAARAHPAGLARADR